MKVDVVGRKATKIVTRTCLLTDDTQVVLTVTESRTFAKMPGSVADSDDEKKLPAKAKGALKDDRSDSDEDFDESTDAVSVTQLPELVRIPMPFSHSSNVIHQFASQHYLLNRKMPEFEAYLAEESLLL